MFMARDEIEQDDDYDDRPVKKEENKKVVAGILGILLSPFAAHKFYLGYTKTAIIQVVVGLVTCGLGWWIGVIEGILYLTKPDDEFYQTYQVGKKEWF
jgi:TM2 domain-containing membrane protein YozV